MSQNAETWPDPRLREVWPSAGWRDDHVLVAVSGGADSVALLRALLAAKHRDRGRGRLFAGHLHHGLRGADADADQAWVESLCTRLGVELTVGRADVANDADRSGDGLEAAARAARYDFLQCTAEQIGARFVAVAHTADDQVETVLHRIVRGTGLAGLAGMRMFRPLSLSVTLVRPLLSVRRREIVEYLASIGQDYRTDETNADPRFTRNRLRNELLPTLRSEFNHDVDEAILRLSSQAAEAQSLIAGQAEPLVEQWVALDGDGKVRMNCQRLGEQPPLIVREVCKSAWACAGWPQQAMGFVEWQQLAAMVLARGLVPAVDFPAGIHAERESSELVLSRTAGHS